MSESSSGSSDGDPTADESAQAANLTYAASGVDIEAGALAVERIRDLVKSTRRPEQLGDLGGFAGMMGLPAGMKDPVLVSCTDGVGTKVMIAQRMNQHDTVGIDLVAMSVNDLLVTGAQTLFLLDYVSCGRLDPATMEALIAGIADGCRQAGCALLGGEMAEHPGMQNPDEYDLAAFAVGVVERDAVLGPARVVEGDVVLALPSSGLHSNGYSLARRALLDPAHAGLKLEDPLPGGDESVGEAMLRPTVIYEKAFAAIRDLPGAPLHAAAHITGGGLLENPQRALSDALAVELDLSRVPMPRIMQVIADQGVERQEMLRTFNCGIGMLLYVDAARADELGRKLADAGHEPIVVGRVVARGSDDSEQVRILE